MIIMMALVVAPIHTLLLAADSRHHVYSFVLTCLLFLHDVCLQSGHVSVLLNFKVIL